MRPPTRRRTSVPARAPKSFKRYVLITSTFITLLGLAVLLHQMFFARTVQAVSSNVVISQVYGGAGCTTNGCSTYNRDYIELFNRGTLPQSLSGWSVQYASATGTGNWTPTSLSNVTLQPGQYYLVGEGTGSANTFVNTVPTVDVSGGIAMSATAGKVALVNSTTALSGACPSSASIVDLVGYGSTANCSETSPAPAPSTANADFRAGSGCTDTDVNSSDFTAGAASPRNTFSALHSCSASQPITTNCPSPLNTTQGTAASVGVSATDPDGTVTGATITSASVPGITLTNFTPASSVGGTATATLNVANTTAPGTYGVTIQYSNNDPTQQTATCTVSVTVAPANQLISTTCPGSVTTTQGTAKSANVSAADPDGTVTAATITSAPVPGITLDNFTPASSVGGTATATLNVADTTAAGTYNVTIQYSNNDPTPQTATCPVTVTVSAPPPPAGSLVISQVYGGGGNSSATYRNDFIEIFNRSNAAVNLGSCSVQYASATGTSWQVTALAGVMLQPGQYYLVQESSGGSNGVTLPAADATGGINMSATDGKVALVGSTTALSSSDTCATWKANSLDLVGYGGATCSEGAGAAPALTSSTSALRATAGCTDSDNNAADFSAGAVSPRNTGSPLNVCPVPTPTPTPSPTPTPTPVPTPAPFNAAIKISQVYGGGGNSGSTYTNDFIELYNTGTTPVDITGWTVQYTSASADFAAQTIPTPPNAPTPLTTVLFGTIQPGHYYLIQEAQGNNGTTSLPTPDLTGGILMGGGAGKVALVAGQNVLAGGSAGNCPTDPNIVDFVGYGPTASCAETSPTAALSNLLAAIRKNDGCTDTNNNSNDFLIDGPIPRNGSSPANICGGDPAQISGTGLATPDSLDPASETLLTVSVTPATFPPSTSINVSADLTSIGGSATQQFYDDATNGDAVAGDNVFSYRATVGAFIPTGAKSILATLRDGEGRNATAPITLTVQSPTCGVERWSVKTGTDPDANQVDLNNPVPATIGQLRSLTPPATPPDDQRFGTAEKTVYVVKATMTFFKKETDVDYHIVLQDDNGNTMVSEIPCPCCVGLSSPFVSAIASARAKFDSRFTATPFFQTQPVNIPVQVTGVGFFDFIHGQTGVAPNGIELHPILDIRFLDTTTTVSSATNPSQYGQSVSFTATTVSNGGLGTPTGSVTFLDGINPIGSAALDQSGQATFTTSALAVGSHSITARYEGNGTLAQSTSAALSQTVNKADQTINFAPLAGKTYGDPDFSVSATASSGLPVSFQIVSGPATISGSTVHITGAGTVTVRASQPGDGNYNAAPDADQSFEVAQAGQAINFAALSDKTYGDAPFTVSATGGASGNPVTFSAAGNCTSGGTDGSTITITGAGSCTVTASQAGSANYNPASDVPRTFTINQADAVVTVSGYTGVYDGSAHGATGSATGVGGEDLSNLLNLGASFTDVPGGTANWSFAGNANYKSASGAAAVVINKATPTVSWGNPADITYGTALGNDQLNATASVPGNFVYAPAAGTILNAGSGQALSASFTPTDTTNYNNASAAASINVLKATPTVSVAGGTFTYDGAAHPATGSVVGVGSPGENLGAPDFTYNGGTDAPVNAGTYNVVASFAGNSNYNPASNTATITINKAAPALTWNNPADITYGTPLSSVQLNASADVPGTFTYAPAQGAVLSAGPAQPLLASFTPADVTNYVATTKSVTINVLKATPAFSNLSSPAIGCGTATVNLSGKISSGPLVPTGVVAITLNSVTQNAAIQPDGSFSSAFATGPLTPAGSPFAVTFSYGGDGNFNPAGGASTLTVSDSVPPTITLNGNVISLWPANKQVYTINVTDLVTGASDSCDASVSLSGVVISQVSSDEGTASGGDVVIAADCRSVQLRADRDGSGDGRVYTITFRVRDSYGNATTASAKVIVPHDQSSGNNAVDSGLAYTVTGGCP